MRGPFWLAGLALITIAALRPLPCRGQATADVRGVVRDARGGETLERVEVLLQGTPYRATTDAQGGFAFKAIKPGDYTLHVSTVGYRLVVTSFSLNPGETREFEVALTPDNLGVTTSIQVAAGPFGVAAADSPSVMTLSGNEAKNLASVLADDPLRAVQALPGITSNNDFVSQFSLRAADYSRIGLYLDSVLLHQPFHMVEGDAGSGSLTIFDGDMLEGIDVQTGPYPVRYADSTAGALDVHSREGSRVRPSFRASASASNASFLGEGPLGQQHQGDWIFSARKSYLEYLLNRIAPDASLAFGFFDYQGRVGYDLNRQNHVSFSVIDGYSGLNRATDVKNLGQNDLKTSAYHYTLANLGWSFAPNGRFVATNHFAYMREANDDENKNNVHFDRGQYGEWVWNADASWLWPGQDDSLNFGWSVRRLRDDGFTRTYQFLPQSTLATNVFKGTARRLGAYGEQTWKLCRGRVLFSVGGRWDHLGGDAPQEFSPQASLALVPRSSTRLNFAWGEYVQQPNPDWAFSPLGGNGLRPERSHSYLVSLEQMIDDRTRLRVELYDRQDRDLLFRSYYEPRLLDGVIFNPPFNPPTHNALHGYARGVEIFLQRRSANRLSGWVSYALGYSRLYDDQLGISFPSDYDQRHTVNVYLSYRLRPTVNLSVRSIYGSGMPLPGFYSKTGGVYFLAVARNAVRQKAYARTDVRLNKAYVFDRRKITLFAEAVNLLDRDSLLFTSFNGYDPATGQSRLSMAHMFPILPSAGLVFEF